VSKNLDLSIRDPKKVMYGFIGAAAAMFVLGGGLTFWLNGKIQALEVQHAKITSEVGGSEQIADKLQNTQAIYTQTCQEISMLDHSVTQKSYVPTLLQQLQTLATKNDLTLTSVQPSEITSPVPPASTSTTGTAAAKTPPPPPYDTMDINVNTEGSYAQTQQFIYGLTRFPKILSVVSIQMSPGASATKGASAPIVTTSLHLTAYIFPDPTTPPATSSPTQPTPLRAASVIVPAPTAPTPSGAVGRAALGALSVTKAGNAQANQAIHTL
jgi:Tfp pilus assembly protein PilO